MNRRIQHRDWEDTEPGEVGNLCVLQTSVLKHGSAEREASYMLRTRVKGIALRRCLRHRGATQIWLNCRDVRISGL